MSASPIERRFDAPRSVRRRAAAAASWPVLATIPRVSVNEPVGAASVSTWDADLSESLDSQADPLRVVGDYDVAGGGVSVDPQDRRAHSGSFVDGPHGTHDAFPSELGIAQHPGDEGRDRASESLSFDDAILRQPTNGAPTSRLASRLFRIHSAVAPYAGVIVAVALVLSAGLLYWLMLAPPRETVDYDTYEEIFVPEVEPWGYGAEAQETSDDSIFGGVTLSDASQTPQPTDADPVSNWAAGSAEPVYGQLAPAVPSPANLDGPFAPPGAAVPLTQQTVAAATSPLHVAHPGDSVDIEANAVSDAFFEPQPFESTAAPVFDVAKAFPTTPQQVGPAPALSTGTRTAERPQTASPDATSTR